MPSSSPTDAHEEDQQLPPRKKRNRTPKSPGTYTTGRRQPSARTKEQATPFGQLVLAAMREREETIEHVASMLGIYRDRFHEMITGKNRMLHVRFILQLADFLRIDPPTLLAAYIEDMTHYYYPDLLLLTAFIQQSSQTQQQQQPVLSWTNEQLLPYRQQLAELLTILSIYQQVPLAARTRFVDHMLNTLVLLREDEGFTPTTHVSSDIPHGNNRKDFPQPLA